MRVFQTETLIFGEIRSDVSLNLRGNERWRLWPWFDEAGSPIYSLHVIGMQAGTCPEYHVWVCLRLDEVQKGVIGVPEGLWSSLLSGRDLWSEFRELAVFHQQSSQ